VGDLVAPEARGAHFLCGSIRRARRLALIAVIAGLASLGAISISRCGDPAALRPARGATPAFKLTDASGIEFALSGLAGRTVVVHFFATWCEPCREELPALNRLAARAGVRDIAVVAVSVAEVPVRVRRFVAETPVNFPILLDQDRAVAKSWGVSTLPTTIILDSGLKPRLSVEREFDWDQLDVGQLLQNLTREDGT
jgi:thiol-disulfide isomerase/thioredoxin